MPLAGFCFLDWAEGSSRGFQKVKSRSLRLFMQVIAKQHSKVFSFWIKDVIPTVSSGRRHHTVPYIGCNRHIWDPQTGCHLVVKWLEQASQSPPDDVLFEKYCVAIQIVKNARMRRLCSGKTLAFQAKDAGSIPARRSNYTHKGPVDKGTNNCF